MLSIQYVTEFAWQRCYGGTFSGSCTCDVNNEWHENVLKNQRKAELEGLLQAHLIFLSHLEAESTPFSTET